jgi:hypothetical protein
MLEEELKPAICSKCKGMLIKGVVLHYDNIQRYRAAATIETMKKLKSQLLPHPGHSLDLSPSDYHIF